MVLLEGMHVPISFILTVCVLSNCVHHWKSKANFYGFTYIIVIITEANYNIKNCESDVYGWLEIPSQLMCTNFSPYVYELIKMQAGTSSMVTGAPQKKSWLMLASKEYLAEWALHKAHGANKFVE